MLYWTCPDCDSNLDPGEPCDCHQEEKSHNNGIVADFNFERTPLVKA